jgi:hypothetical protein
MKKLLLVLTALAVVLAFSGMAVAKGAAAKDAACCPMPVKCINVPGKMGPPPPVPPCDIPKFKKPTPPKCVTDKCGNCITIPGSCYAYWKKPTPVPTSVKVDVFKDLCVGKAKGQCQPCGFCVPVKWACKWKTSVICGQVEVPTCKIEDVKYPFEVKCKTVPCPPPDCF